VFRIRLQYLVDLSLAQSVVVSFVSLVVVVVVVVLYLSLVESVVVSLLA
jgi:hypothetical protein